MIFFNRKDRKAEAKFAE